LYSVHGPTLDQSLQAMVQRLTGGKLDGCALFFESTVDRSHALRGNDQVSSRSSYSGRLSLQLQIIQRPVHGQLTEHDQLRNPQQHMPMRAIHQPGEVSGHDFGRGQGFAGVGQQFFTVDAGGDEVAGVGF